MCYMESKMQEQYEHSEAMAEELFGLMEQFEDWLLVMPDVDESVVEGKVNHFHYKDETVEALWQWWKNVKKEREANE